jgi:DNA-binding NarL/FixJ family response regulator
VADSWPVCGLPAAPASWRRNQRRGIEAVLEPTALVAVPAMPQFNRRACVTAAAIARAQSSEIQGDRTIAAFDWDYNDSFREVGTEIVVFIDRQPMTRECIGETLATSLPEWLVQPISGPADLEGQQNPVRTSLVIFNAHHLEMASAEVARDLKEIEALAPGRPIVIMSDRAEASEVTLAFELGARGYVSADMTIADAIGAVRLVAAGGTYVPTVVLDTSLTDQAEAALSNAAETGEAASVTFSPRELQIIEMLQKGAPNKIIAAQLGLALATIKVHVRNIMKKLKARNRTQVVLMTRDLNLTQSRPI